MDYLFRPLRCDCCETDTMHKLNGNKYTCEICGNDIAYFINTAPAMYAIDLRANAESQKRFDEHCKSVINEMKERQTA